MKKQIAIWTAVGVVLVGWSSNKIRAEEGVLMNATVDLSVCGDKVVEGDEECEAEVTTCEALGYIGGEVTCDTSCHWDVTNCTVPTPTQAPVSTSAPVSSSGIANTTTVVNSIANTVAEVVQTIVRATPIIWFDNDGNGKVDSYELAQAAGEWTTSWRAKGDRCDVNHDRDCNLTDFSILMYYIDR